MDKLVYRHEPTLSTITLALGLLVWVALILGTFGLALIYVLLGFIGYVFAQSAVIAWIKGTAVKVSPGQLPGLYERFRFCCDKLGIQKEKEPEIYLLHGNGIFNAFATRFFGRNFVVLLSDIVDAMQEQPEGINFYIGHELGHIRRGHLTGHIWRMPVLWLPLLGAAYSRAKEYTCDLHGRACCASAEAAARALVALAAGARQWQQVSLGDYVKQIRGNGGFWGSFHELIGGYPWLTKRVARSINPDIRLPQRNPLAYLLAVFVPYGGRAAGSMGGLMAVVIVIGMLAAIALPAYQDYTVRAQTLAAWNEAGAVRAALGGYYQSKRKVPQTLADAGAPDHLPGGAELELDTETMEVDVTLKKGVLEMVPRIKNGAIVWHCAAGEGLQSKWLPSSCKSSEQAAK